MNENNNKELHKSVINWYPGHMAKTKKQIKEIINLVDVVVHVIDARIPYSSFVNDIDSFIFGKPQIIFMSKYDLCDKCETDKWVNYYKNKDYKVVTGNLKIGNDYLKIVDNVLDIMKSINKKRNENGLLPKKANVLVLGVPNVGKSTLINRLANRKASEVANVPGVTKNIKRIKINEKIDLIDTPGILWPKFSNLTIAYNLASASIIKETILPIDELALYILEFLSKNYTSQYVKMYGKILFDENKILEIYENISKIRKIALYDESIDYDKINYLIINDVKSGRIKNITFDRIKDIWYNTWQFKKGGI